MVFITDRRRYAVEKLGLIASIRGANGAQFMSSRRDASTIFGSNNRQRPVCEQKRLIKNRLASPINH